MPDADPQPAPEPAPSAPRTRASARLKPEFLVPPSTAHLAEAPALRAIIDSTVAARLASRERYPHTVIRGPVDSGKRSIACMIAAEMGVTPAVLDWMMIRGPQQLNHFFREIPKGGVAVISGIDRLPAPILHDVARAARRERIVPAHPGIHPPDWLERVQAHLGQGEAATRVPRRYHDFTIIGTAQPDANLSAIGFSWVERTLTVAPSPDAMHVRVARLLRRAEIAAEGAAVRELAAAMHMLGLRTIPALGAVVDWMEYEGLRALDMHVAMRAVREVLEPSAEHACVEAMHAIVEAAAAQAPSAPDAPASAEAPGAPDTADHVRSA